MTPAELLAARKSLGLTQERWAEWLGVGRVYVAQLEGGARKPSTTLTRLVEAYLDGARPRLYKRWAEAALAEMRAKPPPSPGAVRPRPASGGKSRR